MRSKRRATLSVVLVLVFVLSFVVSTAIGGPWIPPNCCKLSVTCWDGQVVTGWGEKLEDGRCVVTAYSRSYCGMEPRCRNQNIQ